MEIGRSSGILLHISSLPGRYGIGDLGPSAYQFVDFLERAGQKFWQILPLSPTRIESGNSPYSSPSAFAGNPLLISPEVLVEKGFLEEDEVPVFENRDGSQVDFPTVIAFKKGIFNILTEKYFRQEEAMVKLGIFRQENAFWLEDFSLYSVLTEKLGKQWMKWPEPVRNREKNTLQALRTEYEKEIFQEEWLQYLFYKQWNDIRAYANEKGIWIFGDLPLYVSGLSADCWSHPEFFQLDERGNPAVVSGVPPDLFSETGQLWGSPVYDWAVLHRDDFRWWVERLGQNLKLYDLVRIDHFRGLSSFWGVPGDHETAEQGIWIKAPGSALMDVLKIHFPEMPFVAEDLGEEIEQEVLDLRDHYGLPGMNILQYAFGGTEGEDRFVPDQYVERSVTYTGTHDNNTTRGWYQETSQEVRDKLCEMLGGDIGAENISEKLIRVAYSSASALAIIPMQDVLGLDADARMNIPGTAEGNWTWRLEEGYRNRGVETWLKEMTEEYQR